MNILLGLLLFDTSKQIQNKRNNKMKVSETQFLSTIEFCEI